MVQITAEFSDLPKTIEPFPNQHVVKYVRPSRMTKLGWDPGSDWESPTSLSFEKDLMKSERYRSSRLFGPDAPIPPSVLLEILQEQWTDLVEAIDTDNHVVDSSYNVGFRLFPMDDLVMSVLEAKTWPDIPGVTTPKLKEL